MITFQVKMIYSVSKTAKEKCSRIRAVTFLSPIPDVTIPTVSIMHELSSLTMLKGIYTCNIHSEGFLVFLIKESNFAGK